MKTTVLLLLGVAALTTVAFTSSAADTALSPRAKDNQIIHVQGTSAATATVASTAALSPRAAANQIQTVGGTNNDANPALACRKMMSGSPKAVGACSDNPAMPLCNPVAVAPLK